MIWHKVGLPQVCEKVGFHRRGNRRKWGERFSPSRAVPSHLVPPFPPLSPAAPAVPPYLAAGEKVGFHRMPPANAEMYQIIFHRDQDV